MKFLPWVSIAALIVLLGTYLYWSWREQRARPIWVRNTFYGGMVFFMALFVVFTWHTLSVVPAQTHSATLTSEVVAGKQVWHKYVCVDCHTMLGNGAYYGPDLTKAWNRFLERASGDEVAARTAMMTFLQHPPGPTADRRGMPNLGMSEAEAMQLVAFHRWVSNINTNGWPPEPMRPIQRATPRAAKITSAMTDQEKQLFVQYGCDGCHAIGGGTILGPDLINVAQKYDHKTLVQWIRDPEAVYRERGQKPLNPGYPEMPALEVSGQDAEVIAAYLLSLSGKE